MLRPGLLEKFGDKVDMLGATCNDGYSGRSGCPDGRVYRRSDNLSRGRSRSGRDELVSMLALCGGLDKQKPPAACAEGALQIMLVAGAGFEPATFRL